MKIDEHQKTAVFQYNIPHFYPLWPFGGLLFAMTVRAISRQSRDSFPMLPDSRGADACFERYAGSKALCCAGCMQYQ